MTLGRSGFLPENDKGATFMFYTEKKLEDNQICLRREIIKMLLAALPFLAVCVVGFAALNQTV